MPKRPLHASVLSQDRITRCFYWMKRGVVVVDPASTFIGPQVRLGAGTVIEPFCILKGRTVVGRRCVLGPFARLSDCRLADGVTVDQSVLEGARVGKGASIGPFTRIRPGTVVGAGAKLGNFCEFKNVRLGRGVRAAHLSYLGDASVGDGANIGAGTITANYDGVRKARTRIGAGAFTGSGTLLVAPVSLGRGAMTGAGAVVLKGRHVPPRGLAVGVPARLLRRRG